MSADFQIELAVQELKGFRCDPTGRQSLQDKLAVVDSASAVAADIHNQAILRKRRNEPDKLIDEFFRRPVIEVPDGR
jgi:hypothetical protein